MRLPGAGKRNRRITIQRFTSTTDAGSGEQIKTWAALATVWAEKSYRSAKEGVSSAEVQAMRVLRFVILWSPVVDDVTPLDRIEFPVSSGTLFDISEVNEIGFHEGVEIFAQARAETPA